MLDYSSSSMPDFLLLSLTSVPAGRSGRTRYRISAVESWTCENMTTDCSVSLSFVCLASGLATSSVHMQKKRERKKKRREKESVCGLSPMNTYRDRDVVTKREAKLGQDRARLADRTGAVGA